MRPTQFSADTIVALLRTQTVVSLAEVMAALGTRARRTAFRKLKDLAARTSYSHRGGYYTLDELVDFDDRGLWSVGDVRFSSAGTLIATAESFVNQAQAGHFGEELDNLLHVGTQDALRKLVRDGRLTRHKLARQRLRGRPQPSAGPSPHRHARTRPLPDVELLRKSSAPPSSWPASSMNASAGQSAGGAATGAFGHGDNFSTSTGCGYARPRGRHRPHRSPVRPGVSGLHHGSTHHDQTCRWTTAECTLFRV